MKILFITGQYSENNANSNCMNNLITVLKADNDIDVLMLGKKNSIQNDSGINKITIDCENSFAYNIKQMMKTNNVTRAIFESLRYAIKKLVLKTCFKYFFPKWHFNADQNLSYAQLKKVVASGKYDCIISISFPFKCHYLSYKIKNEFKNIHWCAYYLDPFSFNITNSFSFSLSKNLENKVLQYADSIVLTEKMKEEFSSCLLNKHLPKSIVCEFPNVKEHIIKEKNHTIKFNPDCVNCVFVGYLYSKIRNPRFFLDILSHTNKNIKFYIVGGFSGNIDEFNLNTDSLNKSVEIVDSVSLDEAFRIMNDADILVNIGNSVQNQLPSKIFDYISLGKPIVNVVKVDNCQTLKYMDKYPYALNIFEKDGISSQLVKNFEEFCNNSYNKRIPFEDVKKIFNTSTSQYVAKQIKGVIGSE